MTKKLKQKNNIEVLDELEDAEYSYQCHELSRWLPTQDHRHLSDENLDTMEND